MLAPVPVLVPVRPVYPGFQKFLDHLVSTEGRSKDTTLLRISEGFEPPMFTAYFRWEPIKEAVRRRGRSNRGSSCSNSSWCAKQ